MFRVDPKQAIADHAARKPEGDADASTLSGLAAEIAARPVERTYSGAIIVGVSQAIEAAVLAILGYGIHAVYVPSGQEGFYLLVVLGAVLATNIGLNLLRAYRITTYRRVVGQFGRVLAVWLSVMAVVTASIFFFKAGDLVSRVWLLSWFLSGAAFLIAYRLLLRFLVQRWTDLGRLKRRTVIVGGGHDAEVLIEQIKN
ncbi:MAG: undecaprenyl-phosphate glucose phosphotransferase, partial [Hyphomicrobiales bacterium]